MAMLKGYGRFLEQPRSDLTNSKFCVIMKTASRLIDVELLQLLEDKFGK